MRKRTPVLVASLAVAAGAAGAALVMPSSVPTAGSMHCTDPATHAVVISGDEIRNEGHNFVCQGGVLVSYVKPNPHVKHLPRGFWWRSITGHVSDCGRKSLPARHPAIVVGYGPGDETSVMLCPPRPWGNGSINPS